MSLKEKLEEKLKGKKTRLICGWCTDEFYADTQRGKTGEFNVIVHCGHILPASKKESTGNIVGRKHIHIPYKDGDIAG